MARLLRWLLRPAARVTFDALSDPSAWHVGEHTIDHKRTGTRLWTSNGVWFLNPYSPDRKLFAAHEKVILWSRVKRAGRVHHQGAYIAQITGMEDNDDS